MFLKNNICLWCYKCSTMQLQLHSYLKQKDLIDLFLLFSSQFCSKVLWWNSKFISPIPSPYQLVISSLIKCLVSDLLTWSSLQLAFSAHQSYLGAFTIHTVYFRSCYYVLYTYCLFKDVRNILKSKTTCKFNNCLFFWLKPVQMNGTIITLPLQTNLLPPFQLNSCKQ